MRLSRARIATVIAVSALVWGPCASASAVVLDPPGKAGANEYFETIPSTGGNAAPPSGASTTAPAIDRSGPSKSALNKLQKSGSEGQAAASFATASAPVVDHASSTRKKRSGQGTARPAKPVTGKRGGRTQPTTEASAAAVAASRTGGSAVSGIIHLLGGSDAGGIGVLLPILLIGGLISAILAAGVRRRHDDDAPPTPTA
jgi:hypothetical protein